MSADAFDTRISCAVVAAKLVVHGCVGDGEGNGEESHEVAVVGLGLDEGLDKGVPLLDEGAHLVAGDGKTVEVGEAIVSLDFLNLELDDSPGEVVFVLLVEIGVSDLEDASTERISGDV